MHIPFPTHIPFEHIAQEVGTPVFVLDLHQVRTRLHRVVAAFPADSCDIFYSIKANPSPALVECARNAGLGMDICSEGDLWLAEYCGIPHEQITCTGIGLTDDFMKQLADKGIRTNLDSISELKRWARVAYGCPVGVRIAPEIQAGFSEHCQSGCWGGKFGVSIDEAWALLRSESKDGALIQGIHMHIGSGILEPGPHLAAVRRLLPLFEAFTQLKYFNLGGGYGTSYHDAEDEIPLERVAADIMEEVRACASRRGKEIRLQVEPGEFIAAPSGYLLSKVLVEKRWERGAERRDALILDASMNHFPAGVLYGSMNRMWLVRAHDAAPEMTYDVYGNTNQSGDRFGGPRELPRAEEGDLVVLGSCGAYASCRGSNFNEHPLAPEVIVEQGVFTVATRRQTFPELFGRFC